MSWILHSQFTDITTAMRNLGLMYLEFYCSIWSYTSFTTLRWRYLPFELIFFCWHCFFFFVTSEYFNSNFFSFLVQEWRKAKTTICDIFNPGSRMLGLGHLLLPGQNHIMGPHCWWISTVQQTVSVTQVLRLARHLALPLGICNLLLLHAAANYRRRYCWQTSNGNSSFLMH